MISRIGFGLQDVIYSMLHQKCKLGKKKEFLVSLPAKVRQ